jgi:hypothetical protein
VWQIIKHSPGPCTPGTAPCGLGTPWHLPPSPTTTQRRLREPLVHTGGRRGPPRGCSRCCLPGSSSRSAPRPRRARAAHQPCPGLLRHLLRPPTSDVTIAPRDVPESSALLPSWHESFPESAPLSGRVSAMRRRLISRSKTCCRRRETPPLLVPRSVT